MLAFKNLLVWGIFRRHYYNTKLVLGQYWLMLRKGVCLNNVLK